MAELGLKRFGGPSGGTSCGTEEEKKEKRKQEEEDYHYSPFDLMTSAPSPPGIPAEKRPTELLCQPLHVPGHARDHVALSLLAAGYPALLSADTFITTKPFYARADEDYHAAILSTSRILDHFGVGVDGMGGDLEFLLCGHFPVAVGGGKKLAERLGYLKVKRDEAYRLRDEEGQTDEIIADKLFGKAARVAALFGVTGGDVSPLNFVRGFLYGPQERPGIKRACDFAGAPGSTMGSVDWGGKREHR